MFAAGGVGGFLDHVAKDKLEEAVVLGEGELIVGGEGGFDSSLGGRSDELEAADEHAGCHDWSGRNAERQDGIDEAARNDVDEARALLEPGIFPCFEHGVGFVGEETLGDEDAFEIGGEGIERGGEFRRGVGSLIVERTEHAITKLSSAAFEENGGGDFVGELILQMDCGIWSDVGGDWN